MGGGRGVAGSVRLFEEWDGSGVPVVAGGCIFDHDGFYYNSLPQDAPGPSVAAARTVQAVREILIRSDPAALVDDAALGRLATGAVSAGLRTWPPILGGERDAGQLMHPEAICDGCGHQRVPAHGHAVHAVLLDVGCVLRKMHIPLRCRMKGCVWKERYVWHNYRVQGGSHFFHGDPDRQECFMLTSSFGFTRMYLRQLHLRLLREHVSFAGEAFVAKAFAEETGQGGQLPERLRLYISEGWFKWRIALRMARMATGGCDGVDPGTLDMAQPANMSACKVWVAAYKHFEDTTAVSARARKDNTTVIAIDGNMKNRRTCCGAPFQHVLSNAALGRSIRLPCQRTPRLGSWFCKEHADWEGSVDEHGASTAADVLVVECRFEIVAHKFAGPVLAGDSNAMMLKVREGDGVETDAEERWVLEAEVEPGAVAAYYARVGIQSLQQAAERKLKKPRRDAARRDFTRRAMKDLTPLWDLLTPAERATTLELHSADADLTAVRCGTHKESQKERILHAQTAGILCACLSSGLIVSMREIFGAESLSQRCFFVSDLKTLYGELEIVVHDDACHLHIFGEARAKSSTHAAAISPPAVRYACDGFHMTGHTDAWCLANCHPQSPPIAERMDGIRTSVCEFTFTWLSQYKHQTKHMSDGTFKWFLLEMIESHNEFVAKGSTAHLPRARRSEPSGQR